MKGTVLILGASGKVGRHSSKAFKDAGWTVKTFDRRKDDMVDAAKGVDVIVNGLNPPNYHDWQTILPAIYGAKLPESLAARRDQGRLGKRGNGYSARQRLPFW